MRYVANAIVALFLALPLGVEARAQTSPASTMAIDQPWARATPGGAKTGAAYMTVKNSGASADRLLGATTSVADKVQFHKETTDNGVSRMQEVPSVNIEGGAVLADDVAVRKGRQHCSDGLDRKSRCHGARKHGLDEANARSHNEKIS